MTKPIALIKIKRPTNDRENDEIRNYVQPMIEQKLPDYRVLVIGLLDNVDLTIEIFNGEDITDIQFNDLKEMILK